MMEFFKGDFFIIIGIIASFAIPIYSDAVERSRCDNVRINLITLHSACEIFNANFGSYPTTDDLNIEQLNTWLGLNIVTDDFSYLYKVGPPPFITASRAINNPYSIVVDIGSQVNSENPDPCPNSY